jgi:integrase
MKLLKTDVDALEPIPNGDLYAWDSEFPGFGVKVSRSGRKTFVLQYRHAGRSHRMTIAKLGELTISQARKSAIRLRAQIANGADPLQERRAQRQDPTVRELALRYLEDHSKAHKKQSSYEGDQRNLRLHVLPKIGSYRVSDLTRRDLVELHREMRDTPIIANRTLAVLSKMFSLAALWGVREDNPAKGVPKYRENRRERYLSEKELARLGKALRIAETQESEIASAVPAIRLLLLTGCRKGEILDLQWDDVDFDRSLLWLRDSKTGARTVPMNAPAREVLVGLYENRISDGWVIEGRHRGKKLKGLWRAWDRIRTTAALPNLRIHDLRHTHASVGARAGLSLPVIGALLGHSSPATTARYAHLADDHRIRASDLVASRLTLSLAAPVEERCVEVEEPLFQPASDSRDEISGTDLLRNTARANS